MSILNFDQIRLRAAILFEKIINGLPFLFAVRKLLGGGPQKLDNVLSYESDQIF